MRRGEDDVVDTGKQDGKEPAVHAELVAVRGHQALADPEYYELLREAIQ